MRENQFGKLSEFYLTAAYRDGRTVMEDVSFTAPFKVMHPFYEKKDVMTVMLLTASAGIMAGDRQEITGRISAFLQLHGGSRPPEWIIILPL